MLQCRAMQWTPRVTVAAVIAREGRFLLVEESVQGRTVINQPAGHLEDGESLLAAARREALEETGLEFTPEALVGVYRFRQPDTGRTWLRFCFCGPASDAAGGTPRSPEILRTLWLTRAEIEARADRLRTPLVTRCVSDYLAGARHPLALLAEPGSATAPAGAGA